MPYFRVDDRFDEHRKVLQIPKRERSAVLGLWLRAGTWSAGQLTDGDVLRSVAEDKADRPRHVEVLVDVGLWHAHDVECGSPTCLPASSDGWRFHDWGQWQLTRQQIAEKRKAAAERLARWREKNARETE